MKHLYAMLFSMASFAMFAQSDTIQGICSITLTSAEETRQQFYCYDALQPIVPITYAINGSGYTVTGLPPGLTTSFSAGILTISGTPTFYGLWYYQVETTEGCTSSIGGLGFSQILEPALFCTNVTDHSVTLNWPDLSTMQDGILYVGWDTGTDADTLVYFLPIDLTSYTLDGLSPGTTVNFFFWIEQGTPLCMDVGVNYSCGTTLGVPEMESKGFRFFPNPATNDIEFSGEFPVEKIVFYDLLGREISQIISPSQRVDVSALPPAIYLMKVMGSDKVKSFKLVRE